MFDSKQKSLLKTKEKTSALTNGFLNAGLAKSAETRSNNGALKYKGTTDEFVNQFGKVSGYKTPRTFADISNDMARLWAINPLLTVCFTLYLRIITRVVQFFDGTKTKSAQRGAGLKHEAIYRMMWIHIYHPKTFWKNIQLFISVGCWKDIFKMLTYDITSNGWANRKLDWDGLGKIILAGLENKSTSQLVKKYLPSIDAESNCTTLDSQAKTIIAKWLCSLIFEGKGDVNTYSHYKEYRQLKSSGTAHKWQQLISQGKHNLVDFNTVAGRALALMVSGKYIENQGLGKKYQEWIESKPVAKFTGYVYELAANISKARTKYQEDTINAQFNQLLQTAGKTAKGGWIAVKDTSGSMNGVAVGTGISAYDVAKSMSIFLARILQGPFQNHYIDFSSKSILRVLQGSNFVEWWRTERREQSMNTNLQSVANLFVEILHKGTKESDFPQGVVCLSDGEFDNPRWSGYEFGNKIFDTTNLDAFRNALRKGGFSKEYCDNFKFCFWDITHNRGGGKFETRNIQDNVFYFGGFDPAIVTFLTGVEGEEQKHESPKNALEVFENAMSQEVLNRVEV